jgi:serine-threonine kinase receptor-associated protein
MELSPANSTLVITAGNSVSFVPLIPSSFPIHTVSLPSSAQPSSASLHPTLRDRFVAGSSKDPWVRVYSYETGEEREVYKGHHGPVHCVEYSPDGEMYATGSGKYSRNNCISVLLLTKTLQRMGLFVFGKLPQENHTAYGKETEEE